MPIGLVFFPYVILEKKINKKSINNNKKKDNKKKVNFCFCLCVLNMNVMHAAEKEKKYYLKGKENSLRPKRVYRYIHDFFFF